MRNQTLTNTHQATKPSIHTYIYAYMNNNANCCMHTQHPTIAYTHTHAHIQSHGKPNMHILADRHKHTAFKYAYMQGRIHTNTHPYKRSGIHSGRQSDIHTCRQEHTHTHSPIYSHTYIPGQTGIHHICIQPYIPCMNTCTHAHRPIHT